MLRGKLVIPRRSMLLTIVLASAVGVVTRTYFFWQAGLGDLSMVVTQNPIGAATELKPQIAARAVTCAAAVVAT